MSDDTSVDLAAIEARLGELEAASDARRAELRAVIDELPAAISRRGLITAAVADLRDAPNKGEIVVRATRKVGRIPGALWRRARHRNAS